jgi:hypothetical protein
MSDMKFIELTPEEKAKRRKRSIALAWTLGILMVLFYCLTVFKLGAGVLNK